MFTETAACAAGCCRDWRDPILCERATHPTLRAQQHGIVARKKSDGYSGSKQAVASYPGSRALHRFGCLRANKARAAPGSSSLHAADGVRILRRKRVGVGGRESRPREIRRGLAHWIGRIGRCSGRSCDSSGPSAQQNRSSDGTCVADQDFSILWTPGFSSAFALSRREIPGGRVGTDFSIGSLQLLSQPQAKARPLAAHGPECHRRGRDAAHTRSARGVAGRSTRHGMPGGPSKGRNDFHQTRLCAGGESRRAVKAELRLLQIDRARVSSPSAYGGWCGLRS
jgi:hypothetical protein